MEQDTQPQSLNEREKWESHFGLTYKTFIRKIYDTQNNGNSTKIRRIRAHFNIKMRMLHIN